MNCDHCKAELKETDKEVHVFKCPKCKCVFRLVLVKHDGKCYEKRFGGKRKRKKPELEKRKRGRPRKILDEVKGQSGVEGGIIAPYPNEKTEESDNES